VYNEGLERAAERQWERYLEEANNAEIERGDIERYQRAGEAEGEAEGEGEALEVFAGEARNFFGAVHKKKTSEVSDGVRYERTTEKADLEEIQGRKEEIDHRGVYIARTQKLLEKGSLEHKGKTLTPSPPATKQTPTAILTEASPPKGRGTPDRTDSQVFEGTTPYKPGEVFETGIGKEDVNDEQPVYIVEQEGAALERTGKEETKKTARLVPGQRVHHRTRERFRSPGTVLHNAAEFATLVAPIRRSAQEIVFIGI